MFKNVPKCSKPCKHGSDFEDFQTNSIVSTRTFFKNIGTNEQTSETSKKLFDKEMKKNKMLLFCFFVFVTLLLHVVVSWSSCENRGHNLLCEASPQANHYQPGSNHYPNTSFFSIFFFYVFKKMWSVWDGLPRGIIIKPAAKTPHGSHFCICFVGNDHVYTTKRPYTGRRSGQIDSGTTVRPNGHNHPAVQLCVSTTVPRTLLPATNNLYHFLFPIT